MLLDFPFFTLKQFYTKEFKDYLNNNFDDDIIIYKNYELEKEL